MDYAAALDYLLSFTDWRRPVVQRPDAAANLPQGAALIEKATDSKDRAALMPLGWIDRQLEAGRVLFMLDGLDEVEPELRDRLEAISQPRIGLVSWRSYAHRVGL